MSTYHPTPTMWEFMQSESFVRLIMGPIGSGKSVACSHEIIRRALQQRPNHNGERKFRAAIIRNTVDQLRSTTMKTFFDWFPPGVWGDYKASEKTFYIDQPLSDGTTAKAEILFLSLDSPDDVRKALSLELTMVWGNEARELHRDVIDGLLMRLRRYPSMKDGGPSWSGAVFDTNAPDQDSWLFHKMEHPPENWDVFVQPPAVLNREEWLSKFGAAPEWKSTTDSENVEWWVNPEADNVLNLDPDYYPGNIPGKTRDFIDVYLRCKYGRSLSGRPVYDKTFNAEVHIADKPYLPLRSQEHPIIIGLDFGRTPSAALLQRNIFGQVIVLDELTSENMGIETFLETKLRPLLAQERYLGCGFIVAPDPAGFAKQQIGEVSPVDVVKKAGFHVVRPATNDPERRIQAVERLLSANVGGRPMLQINSSCEQLIKGFRFGYRYKVNKQGVQDDKPDKNSHSHIHDACQYACLVAEANQLHGSYFGTRTKRAISAGHSGGWT